MHFWKSAALGEWKNQTKEWKRQGIYPRGISPCLLVPNMPSRHMGHTMMMTPLGTIHSLPWVCDVLSNVSPFCEMPQLSRDTLSKHLITSHLEGVKVQLQSCLGQLWRATPALGRPIGSAEDFFKTALQTNFFLSLFSWFFMLPAHAACGGPKNLFLRVRFSRNLICEQIN